MITANDFLLRVSLENMKRIEQNGFCLEFLCRDENHKIVAHNILETESGMGLYENPLLSSDPIGLIGKIADGKKVFLVASEIGEFTLDKYKIVIAESADDAVAIFNYVVGGSPFAWGRVVGEIIL